MSDLNDLNIFSQVVEHNGFTGAARALGIAPSSVSRRVGQLEERLGIRLVQRTTRHFAITDFGMDFYGYCAKMVADGRAAYEMAACAKATPSGIIRISCPTLLAHSLVGALIPQFVARNPQVRVALETIDRRVDLEENFDLCIRVQQMPSEDSAMVMRSLGVLQQVLVASPDFLNRHGRPCAPDQAARHPTLSYGSVRGPHFWRMVTPEEREIQIRHDPTLVADDATVIRGAAIMGTGIAQLPLSSCITEIRQGLLELVLPEFLLPLCEIQAVYPSRRGMLPAVRLFIDFLVADCVSELTERQIKRQGGRGQRENARFWTSKVPLQEQIAAAASAADAHTARSNDRARLLAESKSKPLRGTSRTDLRPAL